MQRFKKVGNPLEANKTRMGKIEKEINERLDTLYSEKGQARLISV